MKLIGVWDGGERAAGNQEGEVQGMECGGRETELKVLGNGRPELKDSRKMRRRLTWHRPMRTGQSCQRGTQVTAKEELSSRPPSDRTAMKELTGIEDLLCRCREGDEAGKQ